MADIQRVVLLMFCFKIAAFTDPACVIDLQCEECLPEHMPLVTSHRAVDGRVALADGDEVRLSCGGGGKFLAFPLRGALTARCAGGLYLVPDGAPRHLLHLGCQESVFEDVLHQDPAEPCEGALQARAYLRQLEGGGARLLAAVCYDADRGLAVRARLAADGPAPPLAAPRAPLSLLGNFNHMFDARTRLAAERVYADEARTNRRLRELLRPAGVTLAGQAVAAARLLPAAYFDAQEARAAAVASNAFGAWASVTAGNLRHLQADVARLLRRARAGGGRGGLRLHAGTHGAGRLRAAAAAAAGAVPVALGAGGRFPVPRYVWTAVLDERARRGVALVLLNDPFVAVSEIRDAVFCESACARVSWLRDLRRNRNYETPLYGLVFCCALREFADAVPEMPKRLVEGVAPGDEGLLLEYDI